MAIQYQTLIDADIYFSYTDRESPTYGVCEERDFYWKTLKWPEKYKKTGDAINRANNSKHHKKYGYKRGDLTRKRRNAQQKLRNAVQAGKLIRPNTCTSCKNIDIRIEAHHEDYNKPLEVVWLCIKCHRGIHFNY